VEPAEGGRLRYRSMSGTASFAAWCLVLLSMTVGAAWSAVTTGAAPWFFAVWCAGILFLGVWSMFLELTVDGEGNLHFRSLVRRRTWAAADLRTIRPGSGCMVFKFSARSAMLAGRPGRRGRRSDWETLLDRLAELNPAVEIFQCAS